MEKKDVEQIIGAIADQKKEAKEDLAELKTSVDTKLDEVTTSTKELVNDTAAELKTTVEALDTRMKEAETSLRQRGVSLPGVTETKDQFSFFRAIDAMLTNDWSKAGFEKEVFDQTRKRAMSAGTNTAGGFIVPNQYIAELIELLRAESVVMSMGATVINNLTGSPFEMPKQTGGATAYWVGENAEITASDLTVGQITMTPKAVGALVKLSNRLLKLSNPSAEAMVRRDIAQALALKIDLAALRGSGVSGEPTGIANTSSITEVEIGTNGGAFTWDQALEMEGKLEDGNALRGKTGFIMHGKVKRKLKKQKVAQYSGDTGGSYITTPIVTDAMLEDMLGHKFASTTQIPVNLTKGSGTALSEVYFGNWQELLIGEWGGLEILASTETSNAFASNQTWIRAIQEVDMAVRHPESFCLINDATTT